MRFPNLARAFLSLTPLSLAVQADVLVVDISSGSGSNYTTITEAIDASSDGDILLIRAGDYGESVIIDGRSLVLQAEAGAIVDTLQLDIKNLSAGQSVTVRGIDFQGYFLAPALAVRDSQGAVWVEDAELTGSEPGFPFPSGGAQIWNSSAVVLSRCTVAPFQHAARFSGLYIDQSTVTLHACTIQGGTGFDGVFPSPGTAAVELVGSSLLVSDSTLIGGTGGSQTGPFINCRDGSSGGIGLQATSASVAQVFGTVLRGGQGGPGLMSCPQGPTGPTSAVDDSSSVMVDAQGLGWMTQASPVRAGNTFATSVTGEPGSFAWSVYGNAPTAGASSAAYLGLPHVSLTPLLLQPLGLIPASGSLPLTASSTGLLPAGADGANVVSQLVTFSPTESDIRVGGGSALLVLDPAF